jgi:gliding motility-associated-like protein
MIACCCKVNIIKYYPASVVTGLLLLFFCNLYSQNYVLNPSFEQITSCPDTYFEISKSPPWFSPYCESTTIGSHGQAVLYTSVFPCNNSQTNVPKNDFCNQSAHTGSSYAGIIVLSSIQLYAENRQYLETKLTQPLQAGNKYYFSMFYSLPPGDYYHPFEKDICFNTNSLGVYFSEDVIDNHPNCQPMLLSPHITATNTQITPADKWYELSGCYTAKGNEQYITMGNFARNLTSDCTGKDSVGYYLLIDDVTVTPSVNKLTDTVLCSGKNWSIDAQTFRDEYNYLTGWQYKWNDGDTSRQRKFTAPGNYTLSITKGCFEDVYQFNIAYGDCVCKNYIATAFTPDGDNINDVFLPKIVCKSGQMSGYIFSIFNRWGQKLFSTTSLNTAWDGKFSGKKVSPGAYVYVVQYKTAASPKMISVKGTVMVLDQ